MFVETTQKLIVKVVLEKTIRIMTEKGYKPLTYVEKDNGFEITIPSNDFGECIGYVKHNVFNSFDEQIDWNIVIATNTCADCGHRIDVSKYVFKKDGKILVLGEGCAKKRNLNYLKDLFDLFKEVKKIDRDFEKEEQTYDYKIPLKYFIDTAYTVIKKNGFKPSTSAESTRNEILTFHGNVDETEGEKIIDYWKNKPIRSDFDFTRIKLIEQKEVSVKKAGYVAALVNSYIKAMESQDENLAEIFTKKNEPFEAILTSIKEKTFRISSYKSTSTKEFTLMLENGLKIVFNSNAKRFESLAVGSKISVSEYVVKNTYKGMVVISKVKL